MQWCRSVLVVALGALALAAAPARAQESLLRAMDLEEQGRFVEAAAAFRAVLAAEPVNVGALLGAERVNAGIGRRDSTAALARRALALDSTNRTFHVVLLRSLRALREDSLGAAAFERWVALAPRDAAPYVELARLLLAVGRDSQARALIGRARSRLADPGAAAAELAQIEMREAFFTRAAEEWRTAVAREPGKADAAAYSLQAVLPDERDGVLRVLGSGPAAAVGRQIAAELLLGWNEPRRSWAMLRAALADSGAQRAAALRRFAERAGRLDGREAQRVAAEALEALAASQPGPDAEQTRIESARAYASAGDGVAARRLLRAIAEAPGASASMVTAARATLIELAARQGDADEAARLLDADRARLPVREMLRLSRRVAFAYLRSGRLDRATAAAAADSSLAGDEVRGWVAVFRGDLRGGTALLRTVGADAGDAALTPDRAAVVALVSAVGRDSMPELGAALLRAAQGDTLGASHAMAAAARQLEGDGQAAALLWSARLAEAARDTAGAEGLWGEVAGRYPSSPAGAASLLGLARVAAARGQLAVAAARLEELILRSPESALVPEARRQLDRIRGLVPRS